jgi:hypothetical protein
LRSHLLVASIPWHKLMSGTKYGKELMSGTRRSVRNPRSNAGARNETLKPSLPH